MRDPKAVPRASFGESSLAVKILTPSTVNIYIYLFIYIYLRFNYRTSCTELNENKYSSNEIFIDIQLF